MVDATRVFEPGFQVTNAAGTPQSGAVLRFYNAGTSNTRTVYSDLGLSTSLGVTVTTNSSGRPAASGGAGAEILVYTGTTAYKVTAETSAGVSLWSFDNVIGALDTSSFLTSAVTAETPVISKTANYTILTTDQGKIINANPNGGTFTLTLPSAVTAGDGWRLTIRNVGTSNQVNIATVSAQTVDGQTSLSLTVYLQAVTLVSDGANWHISETANNPVVARMYTAAGLGISLIGGNVVASVATNILTLAIKNSTGDDPSAFAPVKIVVRGQSAAVEEFVSYNITAATSITVPDTATLGTSSSTAFKIWVVGFDDAGTYRIGVINCRDGSDIYPLGQFPIGSSLSVGTGADSPNTFYTGSAVSSKPYHILGYATWESGVGTAGSWSAAPTRFQLFGQGIPLPGSVIQSVRSLVTASSTSTTAIPYDNTIPQNTEGAEVTTKAITPTSASNLLNIRARVLASADVASTTLIAPLFQDSTADAITVGSCGTGGAQILTSAEIDHWMLAAVTSSTTFKLRVGISTADQVTINGKGGSQSFNGTANSYLIISEVMT